MVNVFIYAQILKEKILYQNYEFVLIWHFKSDSFLLKVAASQLFRSRNLDILLPHF